MWDSVIEHPTDVTIVYTVQTLVPALSDHVTFTNPFPGKENIIAGHSGTTVIQLATGTLVFPKPLIVFMGLVVNLFLQYR